MYNIEKGECFMKEKKISAVQICFIALGVVINIVGGFIGLTFRLPIYMDSIGTILVASVIGPWGGIVTALLGGLISGMTDIYAIYFLPAGMIVGGIAGKLFPKVAEKKWSIPFIGLLITIPGTLVSACINAFVFGGVTSSGSSILVLILNHLGVNLVVSAMLTQVVTEYLDRCIAIFLVYEVYSVLSSEMKRKIKGEITNGTV